MTTKRNGTKRNRTERPGGRDALPHSRALEHSTSSSTEERTNERRVERPSNGSIDRAGTDAGNERVARRRERRSEHASRRVGSMASSSVASAALRRFGRGILNAATRGERAAAATAARVDATTTTTTKAVWSRGYGSGGDATAASGSATNESGERDDAFLAERKSWKSRVNELRKVWQREFAEKRAAAAEKLEAERAETARAKAERAAEKARAKAARAGASARTQEELKRAKDRKLRIIAGRRWQREHALSLRKQAREVDLLKQSRDWIATPEELEARIEHALAHPERLYK